MTTLKDHLTAIKRQEREFLKTATHDLTAGSMYLTHMFILGAAQRTLSQSLGFRKMIEGRNFPSATILLRTQIDTAMRINALPLIQDRENSMKRLMANEVQFDRLTTLENGKQERLTDAYLRKHLSGQYPWIDKVYTETSDFVHLSFRHLWTAIAKVDDNTRTAHFMLSGVDAKRPEENYFEVCEAFFEVSKIIYQMLRSSWGLARPPSQEDVQNAAT
ncbi:hypothetical protein [Mesorhizobium sp. M1E.F.Ca.ET.041.01.1.1]|uniref:hypothetical protein n=1 Tax=Mesorhizobium sp. M1E.F.Ca.ET.041.01.1.1 TaxID=2496759 RepID=UPI000FCB7AF1|nr:hypothetical protein [Mesorhizobium sp. M1E.F.Ca.ET.041.01.1.1]RUW22094.1 hypothetical protein EOA38_31425 [Mesorhizobium sp. M1E.F.Ca.ET.041.01.1.1]RWD92530.1 MAG: hypothetical protein EOS38_01485 [Mesorhizobium sp.]